MGGDPSYHPTDPSFRPPRGWGRPLWRRLLYALVVALAMAGVGVLALRAFLGSDTMRARVQARVSRLIDQKLGGGSVGDDYGIDWLGRVRIGPIRLNARGESPTVEIASVRVRPSYHALLAGRAEPASVWLHDVTVDAGPGGRNLQALLARIRAARRPSRGDGAPVASTLPIVHFDSLKLSAKVPRLAGPVQVALESGRLELHRSVVGGDVDVRADFAQGGTGSLEASWTRGGPFTFHAQLHSVRTEAIPESVRAKLPFQISRGQLDAELSTLSPAGMHRGALRIAFDLQDLTLEGPRLADAPVGPARVAFHGDLRWDTAWRRLTLEDGELAVGPNQEAKVQLEADLLGRQEPRFSISAHADQLPYQAALDALPKALVPEDAPRLDGTMTVALSLSGPVHAPEAWKLEAKLDLTNLKEAARQRAPSFLKDAFEYRTTDASGHERQVWVGTKNQFFVPLGELPVYVYRAVTTSEDAGFFAHRGFDFDEIKNSIVADAAAGRAVRGGSTISQQLAKNLFLSRQKTYARKVQEALITIALEASLTKQRLLEIYLNIIEWGPGIYGIGEAAHHYFGKDARSLTPKEAAFLATVIPNPIRFHMYYDRGALTDAWEKHVDDLLVKMQQANVITPEELSMAIATPLVFAAKPAAQR